MNWKANETLMINTLNDKVFMEDKFNQNMDQFSESDCVNSMYVLELKYRNMPSTLYGDCFLEKQKYDSLMKKASEIGRQAAYVAAYRDGCYYAWNLSRLTKEGYDFGWAGNFMKATTHFENTEAIEKLSCKLPLTKGRKII
mgnify:FL=1